MTKKTNTINNKTKLQSIKKHFSTATVSSQGYNIKYPISHFWLYTYRNPIKIIVLRDIEMEETEDSEIEIKKKYAMFSKCDP